MQRNERVQDFVAKELEILSVVFLSPVTQWSTLPGEICFTYKYFLKAYLCLACS